jgi:hypothetical protein
MDTSSRWSALLHPYLLVHQELTRGETHLGQSEKARPHGTGEEKEMPQSQAPRRQGTVRCIEAHLDLFELVIDCYSERLCTNQATRQQTHIQTHM